ncbi:MAG: hypothetical protein AB7L94_06750 [Kofleriaceae bacterium]
MPAELDDLMRASLAATTDAERAELGKAIASVPDVIAQLGARLRSADWDTRRIAMHFVTRLAPPPEELTPAIATVLLSPLSRDPFGEETVLGLVIAGAVASRVTAQRFCIAQRLGWIERAIAVGSDEVADHPGEPTQFDLRASTVKKLALDTLAKIDAAIAIEAEKRAALVATIADRFATSPGDAVTMVALTSATSPDDRYAYAAGIWRAVAHRFPAVSPQRRAALEHALESMRWYASGATAGGEGLARMDDVHELEREIAALPVG